MRRRVIDEKLLAELENIEPSPRWLGHYPCAAVLRNGEILERVHLFEIDEQAIARGCELTFGVELTPEDIFSRENTVPIRELEHVFPSRFRMSFELARKIYDAGESAMGFYIFTSVLCDGRKWPSLSSCTDVDFPPLPKGATAEMIVDVIPHEGDRSSLNGTEPVCTSYFFRPT